MKLLIWSFLLLLWGAAMQGSLLIGTMSFSWTHIACGPWGCGPRAEDLLACHLFWTAMFCAPLYLLLHCSSEVCKNAGRVFSATGGGLLFAVVVYELVTWLPAVDSSMYVYLPQRLLYSVITIVELPMVQFLAVGLICLNTGDRSEKSDYSSPSCVQLLELKILSV